MCVLYLIFLLSKSSGSEVHSSWRIPDQEHNVRCLDSGVQCRCLDIVWCDDKELWFSVEPVSVAKGMFIRCLRHDFYAVIYILFSKYYISFISQHAILISHDYLCVLYLRVESLLMALPLLPHEHISPVFNGIAGETATPLLHHLLEHIYTRYGSMASKIMLCVSARG